MNYIQVIEEHQTEVLIKINIELYQKLLETINSERNMKDQIISHDFLRRIVPFFMNQFLKWSMDKNDDNLINATNILWKLKKSKNSKQQKFELGDLKFIFKPSLSKHKNYQQIRKAWQEFLNSNEIINSIENNKRILKDTKQQYKNAIELLKYELEKRQPYSKFLSKYYKANIIQNQQNIDEQIIEENLFYEESRQSTHNYFS